MKREMKGEISRIILEAILETAGNVADVMNTVLEAGYGASCEKLDYYRRQSASRREKDREKAEEEIRAIQKYYKMMSALKRDGLVANNPSRAGKVYSVTTKGLKKLFQLQKRVECMLPKPTYKEEASPREAIVIFDIPEKHKQKRAWLRGALRDLGFKMVQKSVWMGKVQVPKPFLKDLRELKLAQYVDIFEVTRRGSLPEW